MFPSTTGCPSRRPPEYGGGNGLAAAIAGVTVGVLALGGAFSQAHAEPIEKRVGYADLDLRGPVGQAVLQARVRNAARQVCGPMTSDILRDKSRVCMRDALSQAEPQMRRAIDAAQRPD